MADIEALIRQLSNENTAKTFSFNSQEAQKERDWSLNMSNTSHQREVDDLKRAGLNPVLSTNGGASAYSASSASASADNSAPALLASIYQTKLNNQNNAKIAAAQRKQDLQIAKLNNKNNLQLAKINQATSKYASDKASSASKYASDNSYAGTVYSSDTGYAGTKYSQGQANKRTKYSTDRSKYGLIYNTANNFSKGSTGKSVSKNAYKAGKKSKTLVKRVGSALKKFFID